MKHTHDLPVGAAGIPPGLVALARGRDVLPTEEAAPVINRQPATLRQWASTNSGPIKPVRIHGRLAWRVIDLAWLLNGADGRTAEADIRAAFVGAQR